MNFPAGQGEEATQHLLHLLHSLTFDFEVVRKMLKSTSDCKIVFEKASEPQIIKKGFKRTFLTFLRERASQGGHGPVMLF